MTVIRTYECTDCRTVFEVTHESGDEGFPDCPNCSKVLEWRPKPVAITGNKSRAVDVAQEILEQDYGLTNWKDNTREGETVVMNHVPTTAEREANEKSAAEFERAISSARVGHDVYAHGSEQPPIDQRLAPQIQSFWGGGQNSTAPTVAQASQFLAAAKSGPEANVDPMKMLSDAGRKGLLPTGFRVVGRS